MIFVEENTYDSYSVRVVCLLSYCIGKMPKFSVVFSVNLIIM